MNPTSIAQMNGARFVRWGARRLQLGSVIGILGLATLVAPAVGSATPPETTPQRLQAGDTVKIAFPGTPTLDTTQQIRRDGKLNLIAVGEILAAGKTPVELEKELSEVYATQLVSKEVKITVVSSSFAVFVTGAVLRPGKLQPDRMLTAFEAIMEAGGFDYAKANTKAVRVIRNDGTKTQSFTIDLKAVLDGKPSEAFYLQANDTVYVPEKFQWF